MKKMSILIVEDEPSVLDAISIILRDTGYSTTCAATGLAGIGQASRANFDLAIIDLRLPDISGLKVLECLLQCHPGLMAIIISAYDLPEELGGGLGIGVTRTLVKPFLPPALLDAVQGSLSAQRSRESKAR
jgi:DNA-binding response OmpR family regulator